MSFEIHPWLISETSFDPKKVRFSESLTSLGNGYMGLRGNFEEDYSGDTHRGQYIGGVWFPDKTRVGWWKNGYPQYFGKAINSVNIIGIHVVIDGETLDLNKQEVLSFNRSLDMQHGIFKREFSVKTDKGIINVVAERFVSLAEKELLAISYTIKADYEANVVVKPYLDADVHNLDSNYDETFWDLLGEFEIEESIAVLTKTKENPFGAPRFTVAAAMSCWADGLVCDKTFSKTGYVEMEYSGVISPDNPIVLEKFSYIFTDRDHPEDALIPRATRAASRARQIGYAELKEKHVSQWLGRWQDADVEIEGDHAAQQGIRFNLFHLLSTYSGEDPRLNIGPKGFTGEKYGGATYWDTEAYCLPVYMSVSGKEVAKQLLIYRHIQLPEAYINAQAQGLKGALFPMVTFTGLECHNEWEITFEEIHRNGAMVYAIYNYTQYTGDDEYILNDGFDVICGVARFYTDRVHYSKNKNKYMIHGVTGPNEYENNVNNNWYTNRLASWCIEQFVELCEKVDISKLKEHGIEEKELKHMKDIVENMYYCEDKERNIFVQNDTFMDKDLMPASALPDSDRPINQNWSWDKVLRSCFIKQADVLQGLYFLSHLYDDEVIKRNFDFYEPMTVHESSLSPCVHSILAAQIGYYDKAVEMYMRTSRLDLDNINNDTDDGLHITSMAGSWLSIVQGFSGMRNINGLSFSPFLPKDWKSYSYKINYRDNILKVNVTSDFVEFDLIKGEGVNLKVFDKEYNLVDTLKISL